MAWITDAGDRWQPGWAESTDPQVCPWCGEEFDGEDDDSGYTDGDEDVVYCSVNCRDAAHEAEEEAAMDAVEEEE